MENWRQAMITDFGKGIIAGFVIAAILFGVVAGLMYSRNKDKELIKYAEKQIEFETLREDYRNRDPALFLELPGVRGAADGAITDFERKRDEAVFRFRNRLTD
jgi:hypothetical protein